MERDICAIILVDCCQMLRCYWFLASCKLRYESGLDNSPMYDGTFYNETVHHMQLYDVGMSSLFAWETANLAKIAYLTGRSVEGDTLFNRSTTISTLIQQNLWDTDSAAFTNMFSQNSSFYRRMSPTSFYPLLAGLATDEQVLTMIRVHLLNASRLW